MTPQEIGEILKLAACFDQRTVGETDIIAWGMALRDVPFRDALEATAEFCTKHPDRRVAPGDVWIIARRMVRDRFANTPPPIPPRELADDPAAELEWRRNADREIAAGTYVEQPAQVLPPRDMRALRSTFRTLATEGA